jgi:deazaflavin-dependent oxidoreductase (nitroreductase family)
MSDVVPKLLGSPVGRAAMRWVSAANTWVYRRTDGRLGNNWRVGGALRTGVPICLLTTTGRKSKQPRTVPLLYLRDGDAVVLVASQGGLPEHPQWYRNLVADPEVTVQIKATTQRMRARTANDAERDRLWPRLTEVYADYDRYQAWTQREIPVVICEPVRPTGS